MGLRFKNVSFAYPNSAKKVLDNISFNLNQGELVFLLGANGNGKSTLLSLANGQRTPQSGEIRFDDVPLQTIPSTKRAKTVATCFQIHDDIPDFTVGELVLLGRTPYFSRFGRPADSDMDATEKILSKMKLEHLKDRPFHQLSGGEKQRALIAVTLVRNTPYILLDEPTAAADPGNKIFLMRLFREMSKEHGLLVVSHDLDAAKEFADRVILLHSNGTILSDDTPQKALTAENLHTLYGMEI